MKSPKIDTSGQEKAAQAQAAAQEAANNLSANMAADLKTDNMAQVIAGGTADTASGIASTMRKRKPGSGGLSNALGINV